MQSCNVQLIGIFVFGIFKDIRTFKGLTQYILKIYFLSFREHHPFYENFLSSVVGKDETKHKVSKTIESFFHSLSNLLSKQVIVGFFKICTYITCLSEFVLYFKISHLTQANEPSSFCLIEQKYKKKRSQSLLKENIN